MSEILNCSHCTHQFGLLETRYRRSGIKGEMCEKCDSSQDQRPVCAHCSLPLYGNWLTTKRGEFCNHDCAYQAKQHDITALRN